MHKLFSSAALAIFFALNGAHATPAQNGLWHVLDGPEKEKGPAVQIIDTVNGDLSLSVAGRRGTVLRTFTPTKLPATISFRFESTFHPEAKEPPTELFGTGDFRIFIGTKVESETRHGLAAFEGLQFRIFPHLGDSKNNGRGITYRDFYMEPLC